MQCVKEPTNEMDKNAATVVPTNSHCKEAVGGHVQKKSPWLYPCFYPSPHCALDILSLQMGNSSAMVVNTD